jgi:hypothetical protein
MSANIKASVDGTQAIIGVGGVDQMTVSNAGVVTANSFVGAMNSSSVTATGSTTARTLANRFADVVNVKDFGADPTGVVDSSDQIQNAINAGYSIFFPAGVYKISKSLIIRDFNFLFGADLGHSNTDTNQPFGHTKLVFYGDGDACFKTSSPSTTFRFGGFSGLTIMTNGPHVTGWKWIFNLPGLASTNWLNVAAGNASRIDGGVLKSDVVALSPSWINYFTNVQFGLQDFGTEYIADFVFSDSFIVGCYFTGGKGVIDRATGGNAHIGNHIDRVMGVPGQEIAALTIQRPLFHQSENTKQTQIIGCYFDENRNYGIILDSSIVNVNDTYFNTTISGCTFRAGTGFIADILFKSGGVYVTKGASVSNCSMSGLTPFVWDNITKWTETCLIGNTNTGTNYFDILGSKKTIIDPKHGCSLKKIAAIDSYTFNGQPNVSGIFAAQDIPSTSCVLIGSENGNGPFIAGSNNNTGAASELQFRTNNTRRLTVSGTGDVGIGIQIGLSKLHVDGDMTLSNTTTSASATAGTNGSIPAQVAGYLTISINGTSRKIPYYAQ